MKIVINYGGRGSSSYSASGTGFSGGSGSGGKEPERMLLAGNTGWENGNEVSVASTLNRWESKHATLDHEEMLVIGDDGFPTAAFKGDKHSVGFYGEETVGKTVTHNHPSTYGGTFSEADIYNFNQYSQKEIRAVAREGVYSLKATRKADWNGVNNAYAKAQKGLADKANSAVQKVKQAGGSKAAQRKAYVDTYHDWYKKNFKKYGYEYTFTANKGYKLP